MQTLFELLIEGYDAEDKKLANKYKQSDEYKNDVKKRGKFKADLNVARHISMQNSSRLFGKNPNKKINDHMKKKTDIFNDDVGPYYI